VFWVEKTNKQIQWFTLLMFVLQNLIFLWSLSNILLVDKKLKAS
jgi:hypothetical protein